MAQSDKGMPQIGLIFKSKEEAWLFWAAYGGRIGFEVRKRYSNKSKIDGVITSCKYVCAKEGKRQNIQRESIQKCFRPETRTNCDARMCIQLDRLSGNFEVTDVVLEHNHLLYLPQTCHLMVSQRKISEFQAFEIEAADDSGIMPKAAYELATRRVGGPFNLGYTSRDHRNLRYKELSHKFHTMAHKVANSAECCMLLENALDSVGLKLEEKLNASASAMEEPSNDKENGDPNVQQIDDLLRAAQLKKKEIQPKSLRRKKSWLDKMRKGKRKAPKPAVSTKKVAKQQKKNDDIQSQVEVEAGGHKEEANLVGSVSVPRMCLGWLRLKESHRWTFEHKVTEAESIWWIYTGGTCMRSGHNVRSKDRVFWTI